MTEKGKRQLPPGSGTVGRLVTASRTVRVEMASPPEFTLSQSPERSEGETKGAARHDMLLQQPAGGSP